MKKYNGFENEQEQEFITNVVKEAVDFYPKVHTYAVSLDNGTIRVFVNDVKIEFDCFDKVKLMFADWKDKVERVILKRVSEVCSKEF